MKLLRACALGLLLSACASYPSKTKDGFDAFSHRDFPKAAEVYSEGAGESGVDQLLYLFDRGTVNHTAQNYEASNKDFILADQLSEIKDYVAIGKEVASLVTNDRIIDYKGEEFETVLVSAYLAINFAMMGKDEEALVQCRRVNRKLELLRTQGKRDYELNAFAYYLAGVLFERDGNWNNAYVEYKKAAAAAPEAARLKRDLMKGAMWMDSESEKEKWRRRYGAGEEDFKAAQAELKKMGSVVVVYQNGFAPEKVPSEVWYEIPAYRSVYNRHKAINLYVNGEKKARSEVLFDVDQAARRNLEQKYLTLIAKRAAGIAVREVVGNQVAKSAKSEELGFLVKMFLYSISRADLRAWLTLPHDFQIARVALPPGKHKIMLRTDNGTHEDAPRDMGEIEIKKPGDVVLLNYRSLND